MSLQDFNYFVEVFDGKNFATKCNFIPLAAFIIKLV